MGHIRKRTKRRETVLWRLRRAITQEQVAAQLDPPVTQQTFSRWESGEQVPSAEYQRQIAKFYRVPVRAIWPTVSGRRVIRRIDFDKEASA